jgi:hypothetical protein
MKPNRSSCARYPITDLPWPLILRHPGITCDSFIATSSYGVISAVEMILSRTRQCLSVSKLTPILREGTEEYSHESANVTYEKFSGKTPCLDRKPMNSKVACDAPGAGGLPRSDRPT